MFITCIYSVLITDKNNCSFNFCDLTLIINQLVTYSYQKVACQSHTVAGSSLPTRTYFLVCLDESCRSRLWTWPPADCPTEIHQHTYRLYFIGFWPFCGTKFCTHSKESYQTFDNTPSKVGTYRLKAAFLGNTSIKTKVIDYSTTEHRKHNLHCYTAKTSKNKEYRKFHQSVYKLDCTSINGGFPVAISITVQPRDHMSAYNRSTWLVFHLSIAVLFTLLSQLFGKPA